MTLFNIIKVMLKQILTYTQYLLPQQILTRLAGYLADSQRPGVKNALIRYFMRTYKPDMQEAFIEDPYHYPTFNDFFIRQLKPALRPIVAGEKTIASPVDGTIAQIGIIHQRQLLQAKGMYFDLDTLLANDAELANRFEDGGYTTLYLAPHNYHRVHMPCAGTLVKTIYVPGRLFSVNHMTSEIIPQLYSRNERLICLFQTEVGLMAVILVGAMIVGKIQMTWMHQSSRRNAIHTQTFANGPTFQKGDELGYFKLGSTVIMLFEKDSVLWQPTCEAQSTLQFGQWLGNIIAKGPTH